MGRFSSWLDSHFHITERESDIGTEIRAGIITFITMLYILLINPQLLSKAGIPAQDVVVATAAGAATATFICGFFGNLPFGLAPSMGLSAYVSYGLVQSAGFSYQTALTMCLATGLITFLSSLGKISDHVIKVVPACLKVGTVVGMGLFLALIGLEMIQLIVRDEHTLVRMGDWGNASVWLSLFGLVLASILLHHEIRGGMLLGIIIITLTHWAISRTWPSNVLALPHVSNQSLVAFDFASIGLDCIPGIIALTFVSIFDVAGVMYGIAHLAQVVIDDKPESSSVPGGIWAFIGASVGTLISSLLGSTPLIITVESASGVRDGARTGLAACVTALLFAIAAFGAPLFSQIPGAATGPILVLVGAMMMAESAKIQWESMLEAIPAFLTIIFMPFTFSIANGIAVGALFYLLLSIFSGDVFRNIPWCRKWFPPVEFDELETSTNSPIFPPPRAQYHDDPREMQTSIQGKHSYGSHSTNHRNGV